MLLSWLRIPNPVAGMSSYRSYKARRANCVTFCTPGNHLRTIRSPRRVCVSARAAEYTADPHDFTYTVKDLLAVNFVRKCAGNQQSRASSAASPT